MAKMGRPSDYSDDTVRTICARLAAGEPLVTICRDVTMPGLSTVYQWLQANSAFAELYARAREDQADTMADEILAIADEYDTRVLIDANGTQTVVFDSTAVQRNRLRVDARKWVAAKLKPKKYGDRLELEHTGRVRTAREMTDAELESIARSEPALIGPDHASDGGAGANTAQSGPFIVRDVL